MFERRTTVMAIAEERRKQGPDRRATQRYPAVGTSAVLTWHEAGLYHPLDVSLRDISLGGASGFARDVPPMGVPLWFRLRGDETSEWLGATIVGVSRTGVLGRGPRLVHLRFQDPCPYDVLKAAIEGFRHEGLDAEFSAGGLGGRHGFEPEPLLRTARGAATFGEVDASGPARPQRHGVPR